ncbi:MAG: hypothetical protein JKY27_00210, partial [Magnetovibrio sp.]|nr:hypothetical protein [Magnetovibrio sp.]
IPKSEFDSIVIGAKGDLSIVKRRLGLKSGQLTSGNTVAAYIEPSDMKNLRVSSGNEAGASSKWLPGGKTIGGASEAIIDTPPDTQFEFLEF